MLPGAQTLRAQGEGDDLRRLRPHGRHAGLARRHDLQRRSSLDGGEIVSEAVDARAVEGSAAAGEATTAPTAGRRSGAPRPRRPTAARSPIGSDLWLDEFQQEDLLIAPLQLPEDMSVLVATDGDAAAPSRCHRLLADRERHAVGRPAHRRPAASSWPSACSSTSSASVTPAVRAAPAARACRSPVTEPIDLAVEGADKGVISADAPTRRSVTGGAARVRRSSPPSPSRRCCSPAARPTPGRSWPARPTPSPTDIGHRAGGPAGARRHQGAGGAHHRPHRRDRRRRRRGDGRDARRHPPGRRGAGRARDELHAARRDRRLRGAGGDPDQAARDRPAAGLRRLAALGDGRRRRRGGQDREHHAADAGGRLVAVQAHVPVEPRGGDADARPRAGLRRRARRCRRTRRSW